MAVRFSGRWGAVAVVLAVALVGCGDGDDDDGATAESASAPAESTSSTAAMRRSATGGSAPVGLFSPADGHLVQCGTEDAVSWGTITGASGTYEVIGFAVDAPPLDTASALSRKPVQGSPAGGTCYSNVSQWTPEPGTTVTGQLLEMSRPLSVECSPGRRMDYRAVVRVGPDPYRSSPTDLTYYVPGAPYGLNGRQVTGTVSSGMCLGSVQEAG